MADLSTWLPWSVVLAVVLYVWRRLESRMDQLEVRLDQLEARLKGCGRILARSEWPLGRPGPRTRLKLRRRVDPVRTTFSPWRK